eukprot:CAMPEP_0183719712 /NCGR_PEP_ID=MMETSP0737-20130205/12535_1 /TAXON_ID=385413 /ORGANISM="Thalassiosira miniscula, Strain CCMP1093" /LENGTH=356 /DNA_ID=CAMNT_0025949449 /DNA_START=250 /DNA_END=1320 /DNA_ORIENTATION=+
MTVWKAIRSISRSNKSNRLIAIAAILLAKGLVITLAVSIHMYCQILNSDSRLHGHYQTTFSPSVMACVRNISDEQCQIYPCEQRSNGDGAMEEISSPDPYFGYAGHFVYRDRNITKPLPQTLGDTGWDSGCILSDEYKFVFVHVLKSGGTAVKKFIKDSLCGPDDSECAHVPETLVRAEGCIKAIKYHQSYFHFSFVRSPFSRLYSAYSMMDGFPPLNGIRGRPPTRDYSFSDFVLSPNKRELHTSMWPGHYDAQQDMLFSEEACPMFDFLGRVEYFDEDIRRILNHLNATKMLDYLDSIGGKIMPANSWGADKKKSIDGGLRKEYSSPQVMQRVASNYRRDFDLLGYNPHEVPQN